MIANLASWQQQAEQYLFQGNYSRAVSIYEQAIAAEPNNLSYYWYLGLLLLLQGQETEAQMTWMLAMAELEPEQLEIYTKELIEVLQKESERRELQEENSIAWAICHHIREIAPNNISNLLKIIKLSIKLENFSEKEIIDLKIIDILKNENYENLNDELLLEVLREVLDILPLHPISCDFTEACLSYLKGNINCYGVIIDAAMRIGHQFRYPSIAAHLLNLYLDVEPNNLEILRHLAIFYQDYSNFTKGIETAKKCYLQSEKLVDKIFAIHLILRGLMSAGGYWEEVHSTCKQLETLFLEFIKSQPISLHEIQNIRLLTPSFAIPHIQDNPEHFREIHNQVAKIFQANIQIYASENHNLYSHQARQVNQAVVSPVKRLKIGYISYALRQHSVGWLSRWLLKHHNRDKFEIHAYFVDYKLVDDWLQEWYVNEVEYSHKMGMNHWEIADKIFQDEIDILIDLDSITLDITSQVMALKPAPVQATWLGWDASGIPAIDYFIADSYVLPKSAQDYYTEKIWRLPNSYISVDGFEVGVPTLRREDLNIPSDAVVYLSTQRGYKRHPETTRWQIKVLKEVENSYFIVKGLSEQDSIKRFFNQIAEEEGVDVSRLRFLPEFDLESTHRANLSIADIVLDTYPYSGATTTLETLWMGIPIVTRVGEQFAARNSYTMMINAGITEGIAWTAEEYIEWGIRLGKDAGLRQQVSCKLRQSRHTAPLWNAKQFTRDMENAYEQMWQRYVEGLRTK